MSERKRAKGSALGLPLFLWSPDISPSFPSLSSLLRFHISSYGSLTHSFPVIQLVVSAASKSSTYPPTKERVITATCRTSLIILLIIVIITPVYNSNKSSCIFDITSECFPDHDLHFRYAIVCDIMMDMWVVVVVV